MKAAQYSSSILNADEIYLATLYKMNEYEQKGEYVNAERCRVGLEDRKNQLKNNYLYEMDLRHNKERNELNNQTNDKIKSANLFWCNKNKQSKEQSDLNIQDLTLCHRNQSAEVQRNMSQQLSTKFKESMQISNLQKMQEHMAKQKNYTQAHLVQQKIMKLLNEQRNLYHQKCQNQINLNLNTLRHRHNGEMNNLRQRIKKNEENDAKNLKMQMEGIHQKYQNCLKDLKASQQRQILSFKCQFTTQGGQSPVLSSNSKSKTRTTKF